MAKSKKSKGKKSKGKKIALTVVVFLLGILALIALVYMGSLLKLRQKAKKITAGVTADTFRQTETSIIYDINNDEITSLSGIKELYYVSSGDIPQLLKDTFVLLEDRDFYNHAGIDLSAILRASFINAKNNDIEQGASTITQQLAKNMFLTQDVTWERKITEMFVAFELEKKFTKEQILEFYINNIYFANGYYGIEAASKGYFGVDVNELSISQMAFLAGIPKSPYRYDPIANYDKAIERRNNVLKQLYANGNITSLQYYSAVQEEIVISGQNEDKYDYVETYVFYCATRSLMKANGFVFQYSFKTDEEKQAYDDLYSEYYSRYQKSLFTGGYRINTAIDMNKEKILQDAIDSNLKNFKDVNDEGIYTMQSAGVCIDNSTGFVTAIVGGRSQEHDGYTFNRAYQSYRQPGSSIKPILVYAPYMTLGHNPEDKVDDSPIEGGPENYSHEYLGEITLAKALGISSNVCAWRVMQEETPAYGMSFLHAMNFNKIEADDNNQAASIGGFTYGVTPVEMASAYCTLENDGVFREPTCVEKITDSKGNVIIDNASEGKEVYDVVSARKVTSMMVYGITDGILTGAKLKNAIVAAKSGTTNDNKDGWLVGYSRYYTTAIWVGCDIPVSVEGLSGGSYPLSIWREFMEKIHMNMELRDFPGYNGVVTDNNGNKLPIETKEEETTTHPGYGGNSINIGDGDQNANINGMGDKDVDVSGMGDKDAP